MLVLFGWCNDWSIYKLLLTPFGALFYLKGVAPACYYLNIWKGVVPFIVQLIGLGIVGFYPSLVNWPKNIFNSNVAPPPMNPKLNMFTRIKICYAIIMMSKK